MYRVSVCAKWAPLALIRRYSPPYENSYARVCFVRRGRGGGAREGRGRECRVLVCVLCNDVTYDS